jgi:hypothetical protein
MLARGAGEKWFIFPILARYNAAQAKYSEIYALVNAYKLKDRYKTFLNSNGRWVWNFCPERRLFTPTNLATDANEVKR